MCRVVFVIFDLKYKNFNIEEEQPVAFKDVGFNTLNYSSNTYSLEHYHNELKMNKVELGSGIKYPNALKNSYLINKRMWTIGNNLKVEGKLIYY